MLCDPNMGKQYALPTCHNCDNPICYLTSLLLLHLSTSVSPLFLPHLYLLCPFLPPLHHVTGYLPVLAITAYEVRLHFTLLIRHHLTLQPHGPLLVFPFL